MTKKPTLPVVFEYRDLSEYLKDVYKFRKAHENYFSYEKWADEMGLKSRSYLRYLVLGEKTATATLLPTLLRGLKLHEDEVAYFVLLFNFQVAPTADIKAVYTREIFKVWSRRIQETEIKDLAEFLADPLIPQLFTYLSFEDSPADAKQWAQDLNCDIARIQNALKCLIWQKLVDGHVLENGDTLYRTASPFFRVPQNPANTHLRNFHLEGIKQAQDAALGDPENRKLYSTFVALSPEQYTRAQELIRDFNRQLLAIFNERTLNGKKLYRLNQQLVSVSQAVIGQTAEGRTLDPCK